MGFYFLYLSEKSQPAVSLSLILSDRLQSVVNTPLLNQLMIHEYQANKQNNRHAGRMQFFVL